jgi:DNA-binding transcriptional regulator YiaG
MQSIAAQKIARYRADNSLTLKQFGARFGASEQTVRGWEQLGKKPREKVLIAIWTAGIATPEDWFSAPIDRQAAA